MHWSLWISVLLEVKQNYMEIKNYGGESYKARTRSVEKKMVRSRTITEDRDSVIYRCVTAAAKLNDLKQLSMPFLSMRNTQKYQEMHMKSP